MDQFDLKLLEKLAKGWIDLSKLTNSCTMFEGVQVRRKFCGKIFDI